MSTDNMTAQYLEETTPQKLLERAAWHRRKEAELRSRCLQNNANFHADKALDLEAKVQALHVRQPAAVCPYCFDIDDEDAHEFIGDGEDVTIMMQCICGQTYLAKAEKVIVWTTRKYPGEGA